MRTENILGYFNDISEIVKNKTFAIDVTSPGHIFPVTGLTAGNIS